MQNKKDLARWVEQVELVFRNEYILMSPNSIGEVCLLAALSGAFKKEYGCKLVGLFTPHALAALDFFPEAFAHAIQVDLGIQRLITDLGLTMTDRIRRGRLFNTFHEQYGNGRLYELVKLRTIRQNSGLTLTDMYRHMLGLPWDCGFEHGVISERNQSEVEKFLEAHSVSGAYCLLQVGNNTAHSLQKSFWTMLVDRLLSMGLIPIVNAHGARCHPGNIEVPGVVHCDIPLSLLPAIAQASSRVITGVNGAALLLLLTTKGIRIDAIRNDCQNKSDGSSFSSLSFLDQSHLLLVPESIPVDDIYYEWDLSVTANDYQISRVVDQVVRTQSSRQGRRSN